jgi:predicted Zn-dependent peptidase
VDALGASLGASSGFGADLSEISASGLAADLESLLDLASDIALNPIFPNSELAKYKTRRLSNLEEEHSDAAFLAREKLFQELYPGSPAAVIAPTKDSIRRATSEELKEFHDRHYLPNNATLGIAGDVKPEEALALAKKYFGAWKSRSPAPVSPTITPALQPFKISLVNRPGSVQTDIVTGNIAVAYKDPDHIPLIIANHVLGEGSESRLNMNLRESKGYTYDAISDVEMNRYPGPWFVSTEVRTPVTGDALRELLAEFSRLREEKVPGPELADSKRAVVARFALSLESPSLLLERWMLTKYYGVPDDYWDRYPEVTARVNPAVVQRIAKRYLDAGHMQIVCVGDAKQILEALKKYGPVEVYDSDGKRIQ